MSYYQPQRGQRPGLQAAVMPPPLRMGQSTGLQTTPMQSPQMGRMPQYGLAGAENALTGGFQGAMTAVGSGINQARQDISGHTTGGMRYLDQGRADIMRMLGGGAGGGGGSSINIGPVNVGGGGGPNFSNIQSRGMAAIRDPIQAAQATLGGFVTPGQDAQSLYAALTGASGQDAQAQAFADFQESPATAFLREQGEKSVLRNAAATGGLRGGNVMKELNRFGQGLASQSFNERLSQLAGLSQQGLSAAGQQGQLAGQQAGLSSNLISALSGQQAGIAQSRIGANASIASSKIAAAASMANSRNALRGQLAGQLAGLSGSAAGAYFSAGNNLAGIAQSGGNYAGQLASNYGNNLASARTRAGEMMSGNIGNTTGGLADLINAQGSGLASAIGSGTSNIANLLAGLGNQTGASQEQLASLLANLSTGQAGQVAGLPAIGSYVQTPDYMGLAGQLSGSLGNMATAIGSNYGGNTQPVSNNYAGGGTYQNFDFNVNGNGI